MRRLNLSRTILAFVIVGLVAGAGSTPGRAEQERLVLALYYPWNNLDTWSDPRLSDVPAIPYDGFDPEAIARQLQWAQDAGIDVLVSAWFGPRDDNPTGANLRQLLDAAPPKRLAAAILFETDSPVFFPSLEAQQAALAYALSIHARHPAYFRYQDEPVIVVWHPRGIFIGGQPANRDDARTVQAWRELRDAVDPSRESIWIAETELGIYLDVFDGLTPYNIKGSADPAFYGKWLSSEGALPHLLRAIREWRDAGVRVLINDVIAPNHMQSAEAAAASQERLYAWLAETLGPHVLLKAHVVDWPFGSIHDGEFFLPLGSDPAVYAGTLLAGA